MGVRAGEIAVPEPGLTEEEIVGRARGLIPAIREQQDEAERLGHHTAELDKKFVAAGFYRMLQPRRFGGYEFGLPTFWRVMLAVSEGDPGTGWGLTLGAHHALVVGAFFPEEGQRDIFGPSGDFRCPHRPPPMGTAEPAGKRGGEAGGGYVVSGTWDYCSGIGHATHFMGNAMVAGSDQAIAVVLPRDEVTVLDDWGNGAVLGMSSSGSNSVRVDGVYVPARRTAPGDWTHRTAPAPGAELHGNWMYCGRIYGVYHAGLVIPLIGAARAALQEYEQIILTRQTYFPPQVPRYTHPDYQRVWGRAIALTDAAEAIVLRAGERYMELAARWAGGGEPFGREDDIRLFTMLQQAGQMAVRAVEEIFAAAGSSAARRGTRLQRYYRDVSMYHGHIAAQHMSTAGELARVHFGLPDSLF
ncbi:MAG: acyl-CoA dehydrogenase [Streptosporangiaceae bacterium]|nr:acyl-CoA dehydrogenase [Streptosporangiaceae bacterium]